MPSVKSFGFRLVGKYLCFSVFSADYPEAVGAGGGEAEAAGGEGRCCGESSERRSR